MSSSAIKKHLKDGNLGLAISMLSKRVESLGNYDLTNALEEAETTYRSMLTYLLQGYIDEGISLRRDELLTTLFAINDQTDRIERIINEDIKSKYVYTLKQYERKTSLDRLMQRLEVGLNEEDHEEEVCNMFNYTWTSGLWSKGEYEISGEILNSSNIKDRDKAVFISAVTLSLMEMFDARKMHLLFDAYLLPCNIINQRALVGIILITRIYDSRLDCYPDLKTRFDIYSEDPRFVKEIFSTLILLQYSSITDKVTDRVVNDIMPAFFSKKNGIKKTEAELINEMTQNGENPDWAANKKVNKSIEEMAGLQNEGADIYMGTFRYMKGYPFFNKIAHWFYTFNPDSYLIGDNSEENQKFYNIFIRNAAFCDSDFYSFHFMLQGLGGKDKLFPGGLAGSFSEEELEMLSDKSEKVTISNRTICKNYIFDLYRFFTCHPFHIQFDNPFTKKRKNTDGTEKKVSFSPLETKNFSFLLNDRDEMQTIADFFMRKGFYQEALDMFEIVNPQKIEEDASIWQKIGFCKQKLGKDKSAYKTYLLADNLLPDSRWTMSHIVSLAMKLDIFDVALNYIDLLLVQDDENLKHINNKAICQMKLGDYEGAIPTLFKSDYLEEGNTMTICKLAECYVKTGEMEKAYEKIKSVLHKDDCPMYMRMLYALLVMKCETAERAYYCIREAGTYNRDNMPIEKYFHEALDKYGQTIGIDRGTAMMIHDSIYLDIR